MSSRKKKTGEGAALLDQIREAIRGSGLSLNLLEKQAGVGSGQLSRFLEGRRDLRGKSLEKVCQALGLTLVKETGQ